MARSGCYPVSTTAATASDDSAISERHNAAHPASGEAGIVAQPMMHADPGLPPNPRFRLERIMLRTLKYLFDPDMKKKTPPPFKATPVKLP